MKKNILAVLIASSVISACGGGSGSDSPRKPGEKPGDNELVFVGVVRVIDGYLAGAEVYADANNNGTVDAGEALIGTTDAQGNLKIPQQYESSALVAKAIKDKTVDLDNNSVVSADFEISANAGAKVITPFTHLAKVTGASLEEIAAALNVNLSIISGDYIAAKAQNEAEAKKAHAIARYVVTELQQSTPLETIRETLPTAAEKVDELVNEGKDPDDIQLDYDEQDNSFEVEINLSVKDILTSETQWSFFRFEDNGGSTQTHGYISYTTDNEVCLQILPFNYKDGTQNTPDEFCGTYEVDASGQLTSTVNDIGTSTYTVAYRYQSQNGAKTIVVVSDQGEITWLDNNPALVDPEDFVIAQEQRYYMLSDDASAAGEIDPLVGSMIFKMDGTVQGLEEDGSVGFTTTWDSLSLATNPKYPSGSADIQQIRVNANADVHEHNYLKYRTAGDLVLVYGGRSNNGSGPIVESLELWSTNQPLINVIYDRWKSNIPNRDIVGAWYHGSGGNDPLHLSVFLPDEQFFFMIVGNADGYGESGTEYGSYFWSSNNGTFNNYVAQDSNGEWGFSDTNPLTFEIATNGKSAILTTYENGGDLQVGFTRLTPDSSNPLIGSWYRDGTSVGESQTVVTFFPDNTFILGENEEDGCLGVEQGTYNWDPLTGTFTKTVTINTNDDCGFSDAPIERALVSGDELTLILESEEVVFERVK